MKQTNSFNYSRRSRWLLPVVMLFALLTSANPAWGDAKSLPYSYGFETDLDTEGWTRESNNTDSRRYTYESTSAYEGSCLFKFKYNTNPPQYLISPELEETTNSVSVSFYYRAYNTSNEESFKVGYSTTNNNIASFTWDDEIKTKSTTYTQYSNTFPAGVKYVAIQYTANDKYYLFIDNFNVTENEQYPRPTELVTTGVTTTTATFSWTNGGEETAWNIKYSTTPGFNPSTEGTLVAANSKPFTITSGLDAGTTYYACIQADYGGGNLSGWSNEINFTTKQLAVDLTTGSFADDFESSNNWFFVNGTLTNAWAIGSATNNGGSKSMYISNDGGTTNAYTNNSETMVYATKLFTLAAGKYDISYDWKGYGESTYDYMRAAIVPETELSAGTSVPSGFSTTALPSGWIAIDGGSKLNLSNAFATKAVEATIPSAGNYMVVFGWRNDNSTGTNPAAAIDNFSMALQACPKPTALTASNPTWQGATLSWTAGSDETEWKVIYGAAGFNPESAGTTIDNVTENPYTLTGLSPETEYDVYVKAVKGGDVSAVSNKANFTTDVKYPAPTGLAISNLTTTSATLTWTAGSDTQWEVAINSTGVTPTEAGTVVNAATYDFSDLTTETTYYAFVRSKHDAEYSAWSAGKEFTPSAYTYLTVNDGATTNAYSPIYGYFSAASNLGGQFIIPAANLSEVENKVIKKLTFYSNTAEYDYGGAEFDVCIKEVNDATMTSSMYAWDASWTTVYSGTLAVAGSKMTITFTSDYNYNGSNLLVGIHKTSNDKSGSNYNVSFYGNNDSEYRSNYAPNGGRQKFQPKTTIGYQEKTGAELKVYDGEVELTESPASFNFGLATAGTTHTFTLKNTAATAYVATISSTNLTVSPAEVTPTAEGVTFTVTMPEQDITDEAVVITPANESGLQPFTINISGTVRDNDKFYQEFNTTSLPAGWTEEGSWAYSTTNGANTSAWYIDPSQGSIARLKSPMLNLAAKEKFIIEAKGLSTSNTEYQHLVLQYSADGTNWTTFSDDFGTTISADPTNWKSFTATLPNEVEAGNYYIAVLASQADIRMFYGGEIVSGPHFAINVAPATEQDFGDVEPNAAGPEKSFTITNNGNESLSVDVTNAADFYVKKAINFSNSKNWSNVYLYAWTGENEDKVEYFGSWPGEKQTNITGKNEYEQDIYAINVPVGAKIILNNNDGAQSQDITVDYTKTGLYLGDADGAGKFQGIFFDNDPSSIFNAAGQIVVAEDGGTANFSVKMVTSKTVGNKNGNVVLEYDDIEGTDQQFVIPCKGYVIDHSKLYITFSEDDVWPSEIMRHFDYWSVSDGTANQSSQSDLSSLLTTPVTVVAEKDLKFKVTRYGSIGNNPRDLYLRYTQNGGVTWTEYNWGSGTSLQEEITGSLKEFTVTGIPAGTTVFDFNGKYIKMDDIKADYEVVTAPLMSFTSGGNVVENGSTKDFGNMTLGQSGMASYTLQNLGNANLVATIVTNHATVNQTDINLAPGEFTTINVETQFEQATGLQTGSITITPSLGSWIAPLTVNYKATLIDPTDFVEDFAGNAKPAGWYAETGSIYTGWVFSNGDARIGAGGNKIMITEKIGAEEGKNTLSFDAKAYSGDAQTLNVYTSTDRKTWSAAQVFNITNENDTYHLTALADGNYYVKFEAANAIIDNITGVKKLDAPAHDLYEVSNTITATGVPGASYTAEVTGVSLRANEDDIVAELWLKKGETYYPITAVGPQAMNLNENKTFTLTGNLPNVEGEGYKMYATVKKSSDGSVYFNTDEVDFTLAHNPELTINSFAVTTPAVQANDNNEYTATFNIKVTNTGSRDLTANEVSVSLINKTTDPDVVITSEWTLANSQTIFLNPGGYTSGANMAIYRWNAGDTDEQKEWALFTEISTGFYSAELNGKSNFIICRVNPETAEGDLAWDANIYNQSDDLTTADGNIFSNNGYNGQKLVLTPGTMGTLAKNVSTTLQVTVAGTLTDGENKNLTFYAREDVKNDIYDDGYTYVTQTASITAAPDIELDETAETYDVAANVNNRKVKVARSFNAGWNTICLPFAVSANDLKTQYGNGVALYELTSFESNNLQFTKVNDGVEPAGITAGKPYLIYVEEAITAPKTFLAAQVSAETPADDVKGSATFKGTYTKMATGSLENMYGVSSDNRIAKGNASTTMKGFRAYLEGALSSARIAIIDETTGITRIYGAEEIIGKDDKVYDLNGRRVENAKKGVYIVNGKKIVVK